eukprot:4580168-Pyramimonas_sp.AAC.1
MQGAICPVRPNDLVVVAALVIPTGHVERAGMADMPGDPLPLLVAWSCGGRDPISRRRRSFAWYASRSAAGSRARALPPASGNSG